MMTGNGMKAVAENIMRLLLVDDRKPASVSVVPLLAEAGIQCDVSGLADEKLDRSPTAPYDIVLLDLPLDRIEDGGVIRRLTLSMGRTPVLILCDSVEPDRIMRCLDLGADDYLTRPFQGQDLVARIQSVVRRGVRRVGIAVQVGEITLHPDTRVVEVNGKAVHLTGREYSILELLFAHRGRTVTKEAILNHLYEDKPEPDQKIIDVFVCTLRKKLSVFLTGRSGIETVWGRGYVLRDPDDSAATLALMSPDTVSHEPVTKKNGSPVPALHRIAENGPAGGRARIAYASPSGESLTGSPISVAMLLSSQATSSIIRIRLFLRRTPDLVRALISLDTVSRLLPTLLAISAWVKLGLRTELLFSIPDALARDSSSAWIR